MKAFFVLVLMVAGVHGSAFAYDNLSCEGSGGREQSAGWTLTLKAVGQTVDDVGNQAGNGGHVDFSHGVPYSMVLKKKGTVALDTIVSVSHPHENISFVNESENLLGQLFLVSNNDVFFGWGNWNYWMKCSWGSESN